MGNGLGLSSSWGSAGAAGWVRVRKLATSRGGSGGLAGDDPQQGGRKSVVEVWMEARTILSISEQVPTGNRVVGLIDSNSYLKAAPRCANRYLHARPGGTKAA